MVRKTEQLSMIDARKELTRLPRRLEHEAATVAVTRYGQPVLAIMTWEDYEALLETLEILGDDTAMAALRRSAQDVRQGRTILWREAKARLTAK